MTKDHVRDAPGRAAPRGGRWFGSIHAKLSGVVGALALALVLVLTTYLPAYHLDFARRSLEAKALTSGALLGHEIEPAVAFEDRETAREVFDAAVLDADLRAAGLYKANGDALMVRGEMQGPGPGAASLAAARLVPQGASLRVLVPVSSREGPRGTLVLDFSTRSLDVERARSRRLGLAVGAAAALLGLLSAWLIGRSFGSRLGRIARATSAVAGGDLSQPMIEEKSPDEIGQLALAFNAMLVNLRELVDQISRAAADENERLERLVAERTAALGARTEELLRVLDHVGEGFLAVGRDGTMPSERSAILERWFGPAEQGAKLWEYLAWVDPRAAGWLQASWEPLFEDFLPLEVSLDQLPRSMTSGGCFYRVRYAPICRADGSLELVLVVISDATGDVIRERAEARQRDVLAVLNRIVSDRAGVIEFVEEASRAVADIDRAEAPLAELRRRLHTLKGNAALLGLSHLASLCHELESASSESGEAPSASERVGLIAHWEATVAVLSPMLQQDPVQTLDVNAADCQALALAIERGARPGELLAAIQDWHLERVERRLARMAEQARSAAGRLGKEVEVAVAASRARVESTPLVAFWGALSHVIRNAVDHGIEPPHERVLAGKKRAGRIEIGSEVTAGVLAVELSDDGRGIDWSAVAERARSAGLPHATRAELTEALFHDGLSTRSEVSSTSGRGVGLAAARAACVELGGEVLVVSEPGVGTTFRFLVPVGRRAGRPGSGRNNNVVREIHP